MEEFILIPIPNACILNFIFRLGTSTSYGTFPLGGVYAEWSEVLGGDDNSVD